MIFTIHGPSFFVRCCEHKCLDRRRSLVAYHSCLRASAIASARLYKRALGSQIGNWCFRALRNGLATQSVDQSLERLCSTDASSNEHISYKQASITATVAVQRGSPGCLSSSSPELVAPTTYSTSLQSHVSTTTRNLRYSMFAPCVQVSHLIPQTA